MSSAGIILPLGAVVSIYRLREAQDGKRITQVSTWE